MVGRSIISCLIFLAAVFAAGPAFAAVDVTPLANELLDWAQVALTVLGTIASAFAVRWLSTTTGVKNAELEAKLSSELNQIVQRGIGLAYANAKARVNKGDGLKIEFDNVFIDMVAGYALKSAPGILERFGFTHDRARLEEYIIARLPDWMTDGIELNSSQLEVATAVAKRNVTNASNGQTTG